jgi:signal transduction histidine kinase
VKRHSTRVRRSAKARRRKPAAPKRRNRPKTRRHRSSSGLEAKVGRLTRERDEALEREAATSEILHLISTSPSDLDVVFRAILERATRICEAKFGVLDLRQDDVFRSVAMHNPPPEFAEIRRRNPVVPAGPLSALGRVTATKEPVHVLDYAEDPAYKQGDVAAINMVDHAGARTFLVTPMLKEEEIVGVIAIFRQEIRPFADNQIKLVQNFAAQAVIAIENVRLLTELRESLEQQTATAEVLTVISSSPGKLEPVFTTMLEKALRICDAKFGGLYLYEDGRLRTVAAHDEPEFFKARGGAPWEPPRGGVLDEAIRSRRTVQVADMAATKPYIERHPRTVEAVELAGVRTAVAVPMLKHDEVVGIIAIHRREVLPFTDKQIKLLGNFASQAVIAIENARLLNELRQRTDELSRSVEELRALGEVSQTVNSTLDVETVLSTIVTKAVQLSGTEAGAIYVFDAAQHEFHLRATYGMDQELIAALTRQHIGLDESTVASALEQPEPIQVADLRETTASTVNDIILSAGFRALLVAPLKREDEIVGMLVVRRRTPGAFPQNTVELIKTFAAQSALAIQNARLFHEIEDKGRQLEIASQHKSQFLANMSHELRTPLNAILGYTELIADGAYGDPSEKMLEALKRLEVNGKHLLGLINDVLDLSKIEAGQLELELSDYSLEDIAQAVRSTLEPLAADKKLAFKVEMPARLPPGHGDGRRLTQVLINLVGNAIKFTDAGEVAIKAEANNGAFHVSVRDTGPGISAADQTKLFQEFQQADNAITKKKGGTGLGLAISKRIIEMHGGRIWVESHPGQGSTFAFTLPVTVERQAGRA